MFATLRKFVVNCIHLFSNLTVILVVTASEFADNIQWPPFRVCHEFLKRSFTLLFVKRTYEREGYDEKAVQRGNEYVDLLLENMFQAGVEYRPYRFNDRVFGFNKKTFFGNITANVKLFNGCIKWLNVLHRSNDCSVTDIDQRLQVEADFGGGMLNFLYSGSAQLLNYGRTVTVHGNLPYMDVHIQFTIDPETGGDGRLLKLIINDIRGMRFWVTGLGPLNSLVDIALNGLVKTFTRLITNVLESEIEKILTSEIPQLQFPIERGEVSLLKPPTPDSLPSDEQVSSRHSSENADEKNNTDEQVSNPPSSENAENNTDDISIGEDVHAENHGGVLIYKV